MGVSARPGRLGFILIKVDPILSRLFFTDTL